MTDKLVLFVGEKIWYNEAVTREPLIICFFPAFGGKKPQKYLPKRNKTESIRASQG